MKKNIYIFLIALTVSTLAKAQLPVDSLSGEYFGLRYFKCPIGDPWTITQDTLYVFNIDTFYCSASYYSPSFPGSGGIFHTTYLFCNDSVPYNGYTLFYNGDSIRMIYDDIAQPYPYQHYSFHYYGKRISNHIVSTSSFDNNVQLKIYPNPTDDKITIEVDLQTHIKILYIDGQVLSDFKAVNKKTFVDLKTLPVGIYLLKAQTDKGITIKKFVKL